MIVHGTSSTTIACIDLLSLSLSLFLSLSISFSLSLSISLSLSFYISLYLSLSLSVRSYFLIINDHNFFRPSIILKHSWITKCWILTFVLPIITPRDPPINVISLNPLSQITDFTEIYEAKKWKEGDFEGTTEWWDETRGSKLTGK